MLGACLDMLGMAGSLLLHDFRCHDRLLIRGACFVWCFEAVGS